MTSTNCGVQGRAAARVGLLGNPSDGFGGRVIAITLPEFVASVDVEPADSWHFADSALLEAAVMALRSRRPEVVSAPARLSYRTTIPREVGLSGSSAIVMAALRALAARFDHEWDLVELARITLEVETDELGWTAGPQDRVVQAYGGLLDMDFATPWNDAGYHRLDPALLPPLFVAWSTTPTAASTVVHSDVRQRWLDGDAHVRRSMARFAELAAAGRTALDKGDAALEWPSLIDEAYELRRSIWTITDVDTALVETGRSIGAGVAFAGSGGAVVGCVADVSGLDDAAGAYARIGAGFHVIAP